MTNHPSTLEWPQDDGDGLDPRHLYRFGHTVTLLDNDPGPMELRTFSAVCSCGWESHTFDDVHLVTIEGDVHRSVSG